MGSPLSRAVAAARAVSVDDHARPEERLLACETLIRLGVVDSALPALRNLMSVPECAGRARLLLRTGEYLLRRAFHKDFVSVETGVPRQVIPERAATAFWQNPDPNRAAQSLLIVFTGIQNHFWVSLDVLHRLLRHWFGQVLYLRDFRALYYQGGIQGLGGDYASTLARMKQIARTASVHKLYALGISAGGYGALRYGLDLGVDAILALSPATDLRSDAQHGVVDRLKGLQVPEEDLDLLPAYAEAPRRPKVTIVFGAENHQDSAAAKRFAEFTEFHLVGLADVPHHNIAAHLIGNGDFERLLRDLVKH